jgi:hypothetical protein
MYSQVSGLPVTGFGTAASGYAAYTSGGMWFWVFTALALFTMVGAVCALVRTMPAIRILHREPRQFAPDRRPERPNQFRRRR